MPTYVSALTFVTPSGAVIDTSRPRCGKRVCAGEPQLAEGLLELRESFWQIRCWRIVRVASNAIGTRTDCGSVHFSTVKRRSGFFGASSSGRRAHSRSSLKPVKLERRFRTPLDERAWIPVPTIDEAIALVSWPRQPRRLRRSTDGCSGRLTAAGQAFAENAVLLEKPSIPMPLPARRDRRRGLELARSNTTPGPRAC